MKIIHFRKIKGMTQLQLAKLLNVDQSTVSKWEKQETNPKITTLKKIAEILNCTVDDLIKEN